MRYLSICSGIEAATVAWHPLGWQPVAFAEIEAFPSAVLAHHYPGTPNLGDLTRFREWDPALLAEVDLLVGGTPCQAFSVAGLRQSLNDERGNLTLTLVHLYDHLTALRHAAGRPAPLLLWENVPGVLNTPDNAFGCLLGGLAGEDGALQPPGGRWLDAGHVRGPRRSIAWRILDAQYFGLAQRRERVFLVAGPRESFRAEQVLFEWQSLRRDTPPRREEGEGFTHSIAPCLTSGGRGSERTGDTRGQDPVIAEIRAFGGNNTTGPIPISPAINANRGCHNPGDFEAGTLLVGTRCAASESARLAPEITHSLRAEGFDASEDGTERGTPIVPIAFPEYLSGTQCAATENLSPSLQNLNPTAVAFQERGRKHGRNCETSHELAYSLNAPNGGGRRQEMNVAIAQPFAIQAGAIKENPAIGPDGLGIRQDGCAYTREARSEVQAVAFNLRGREGGAMPEADPDNLACQRAASGGSSRSYVAHQFAVRRLTPRECERLQGFPDDYTLIPWRSKPAQDCPDGPRYKALGNSMAVPVMRWIGRRIASWFDSTSNPRQ